MHFLDGSFVFGRPFCHAVTPTGHIGLRRCASRVSLARVQPIIIAVVVIETSFQWEDVVCSVLVYLLPSIACPGVIDAVERSSSTAAAAAAATQNPEGSQGNNKPSNKQRVAGDVHESFDVIPLFLNCHSLMGVGVGEGGGFFSLLMHHLLPKKTPARRGSRFRLCRVYFHTRFW